MICLISATKKELAIAQNCNIHSVFISARPAKLCLSQTPTITRSRLLRRLPTKNLPAFLRMLLRSTSLVTHRMLGFRMETKLRLGSTSLMAASARSPQMASLWASTSQTQATTASDLPAPKARSRLSISSTSLTSARQTATALVASARATSIWAAQVTKRKKEKTTQSDSISN